MSQAASRMLIHAVSLAVVLLVGAFNVFNLNEAYGNGAPYYSRTTNMDKWVDPLPTLVSIDAFAVLLVSATLFLARRKR
jgi:hypothetical protein